MTEYNLDVSTFTDPWTSTTPHVRIGDLNGVAGLSDGEWGIAAGIDLSDGTAAHLVASNNQLLIDMNGAEAGIVLDENGDTSIGVIDDDKIVIKVGGTTAVTIDDESVAIHDEDGDAVKWLNRTGNTWAEAMDLHAEQMLGLSADHHVVVGIDGDNSTTGGAYFEVRADGLTQQSSLLLFFVCEDSTAGMVLEDVAHGGTDVLEYTNSFYQLEPTDTAGGAMITGAKGSTSTNAGALTLRGMLDENADTTKSAAGRAIIELYAGQESSNDWGDVVADGNVWGLRARRSSAWATVAIIDEDGELHTDDVIGVGDDWDDWDDLALASDLSRLPKARWDEMMRYGAQDFERAGLLTLSTDADGTQHAFVKHKALLQFYACCFREVAQKLGRYERALAALGVDPALLEG